MQLSKIDGARRGISFTSKESAKKEMVIEITVNLIQINY